ncbi:type II toxin-antitoxin system Phd/YefM family antitoxin [Candidatus Gottesmanbacteria bacterium]|nr:type II toxin-antitoxin system Phd/YefM family antitoxin [Candidatus Gottesmanbacteria bacterium]
MKASDVRSNWSQLLNKVFRGETEVVVEKSGIPVAAIVSAQDFEKLQQMKQRRNQDFALISEIRTAFKDQTSVQIQKGVTKAIAQVRRESKNQNAFSK